ncbi:hypothetical protein E2320_008125 [Naja naja]|nr:hypothetical protein E2320_008125 [Naja naja]
MTLMRICLSYLLIEDWNEGEQMPPPDAGKEELRLFCAAQPPTHLSMQWWQQEKSLSVTTTTVILAQEGIPLVHMSVRARERER